VPEWSRATFPCHKLWLDRRATWVELETVMSIDDVDMMCMLSDIWDEPPPTKDR
jgi:hypothetical protein